MKLRQLFDVIVGKVERGEARQTSQLLHLESSGGVQGSNGDTRGAPYQIKGELFEMLSGPGSERCGTGSGMSATWLISPGLGV